MIDRQTWTQDGYSLFNWACDHAEHDVKFSAPARGPIYIIFSNKEDASMFLIAHSTVIKGYIIHDEGS